MRTEDVAYNEVSADFLIEAKGLIQRPFAATISYQPSFALPRESTSPDCYC